MLFDATSVKKFGQNGVTLFTQPKWAGNYRIDIELDDPDWYDEPTEQQLRQMIKDGYLELTTHLTLYGLEGNYDADTLHLIREYADRSSIEAYTVHAYAEQGCRSAENFALFIEVLKESKKVERVRFVMNITRRPDF